MRCDKCDLKATRVVLAQSMPPYDAHYCAAHAPEDAHKFANPPTTYRGKAPLMTLGGPCYLTVGNADAPILKSRLRDYLDCDQIEILSARDVGGSGPYNCFEIPIKLHDRARVYLDGWAQGARDALDRHYDRKVAKHAINAGT